MRSRTRVCCPRVADEKERVGEKNECKLGHQQRLECGGFAWPFCKGTKAVVKKR
jgi:hypothetical protein